MGSKQPEWENDQSERILPVKDQHILICMGEISASELRMWGWGHNILVAWEEGLSGGPQTA